MKASVSTRIPICVLPYPENRRFSRFSAIMKSDEDRNVTKPQSISQTAATTLVNDVKQTAMGVMALLKHDKKKALHQVKQLTKLNKELAYAVLVADVDGWTPVHACVMRGSKKLLKAMLQVGIPINCTMGQPEGLPGKCTLLHVAANRPDKKMLDYLLHHGADVNARDSNGNTALFYAKQSNKDSARLLLSCGAIQDDIQDNSHTETQLHHQAGDNTGRLLASFSNLRKGHSPSRSSNDVCDQLPHKKQHSLQKVSSTRRSVLTAPVGSLSGAKSSPKKAHFLTVPPTKLFSSSPCLHQGTSAGSSASSITSSNSSNDLTSASPGVPIIKSQSKNSINNNNTTITDLNKRELKSGSKSVNTSTESLRKQVDFDISHNNSD